MYTWTINRGDLSAVDIVYRWKVKGETIHLHLIINPKSTCSCSAISFFPNQDGVVWYFFLNKVLFRKKMNAERYHDCFEFGKWIVSPKVVNGYVVSFVVSKYVNTNISKYYVFVD